MIGKFLRVKLVGLSPDFLHCPQRMRQSAALAAVDVEQGFSASSEAERVIALALSSLRMAENAVYALPSWTSYSKFAMEKTGKEREFSKTNRS